eukprot:gb/GFBE01027447.1/.p1 GENE.gb/GFBE01027447.1/~~gb/GFBE01027447.1/.p1  ORF type:complete len:928 (+),score=221.30 gb/GFBE01027447.1/:1-2784(+)
MVAFDAPAYDIDLEEDAGMRQERLVSEIGHALRLKGYCIMKLGTDEDVLEQAGDEAMDLKRARKLRPPPAQLIDALLGPEGTGEYCRLDELPKCEDDEDDEDVQVGPELKKLNERLGGLAAAGISVCATEGWDNCVKSEYYLLRGGDCSDEVVDLTEESCSSWISKLTRAKLMMVYFFGEGRGQLEMMPFDEDSAAVEITTEPDMLVILRADQLHHKHRSSRGEFSIINWVMAAEHSATRGWTGSVSKTLCSAVPTAKELVDWSHRRMQELVELEAREKLETEIPRDWQLMMRHSFVKGNHNPVSVRGEAGHMPSTFSNEVLWSAMNQGCDFVTEVPVNRWEHDVYYDADPNCYLQSVCFRPGGHVKTSVKHAQFIEGIELFDNKFFGISNMEAKGMDPMQRHILETSYEALYNAGYTKKTLMGAYIAVFSGSTNPEWNYIDKEAGACSGTGSSQAITSNRTSFLLGIMGPSTSIDTEQSSAGMALMMGATAVSPNNERRTSSGGDSEAAIVGGVFFHMTPYMWPRFNAYMNPAGRCFSFDQNADGYVRGECCGSVALKPYANRVDGQLVVDEDAPCLGNMVGWRMTNNGRSAGLCAPSGPAEQEAIADSLRHAGIHPLDLDAMECHAAGALLADAVEVSSVATVCRGMEGGDREVLTLGACKTTVAAQQEACAMTAFLKVIFNINFANQVPTVHLKQLNPHLEMGEGAVNINTEAMAYRDSRAFHGVATRGIGGTNINLVCWAVADVSRVPVDRPTMDRASFSFWPGGGGELDSQVKATEGYFLVGSWSNWDRPEELVRQKDGSFSAAVTLGETCAEEFQILIDGDQDKVLHPERPNAVSGSRVVGPTMRYFLQGYRLNWVIDGREVATPLLGDSVDEAMTLRSQLSTSGAAVAQARDRGQPGDRYQVKLLIAGKYRAVTWSKISK